MTSLPTHFTVPLSQTAHTIAKDYAKHQLTPQDRKQAYLNQLSIYAVHRYLTYLNITSELPSSKESECYPLMPTGTALNLPRLGYVICCPILPAQTTLDLPLDLPVAVSSPCLGYVMVQFMESLTEATLIGFLPVPSPVASPVPLSHTQRHLLLRLGQTAKSPLPTMPPSPLALDQCQSLDALLTCIATAQTRLAPAPTQPSLSTPASPHSPTVLSPQAHPIRPFHLRQLFRDIIEPGWQKVSALLGAPLQPVSIYRRIGAQAKPLRFMTADSHPSVALVVQIMSPDRPSPDSATPDYTIHIELQPMANQPYLPANLSLVLIDETNQVFMEAQSTATTEAIKFQFCGVEDEPFQVKVVLNDTSIIESFVI
jgi:hypothetical protein